MSLSAGSGGSTLTHQIPNVYALISPHVWERSCNFNAVGLLLVHFWAYMSNSRVNCTNMKKFAKSLLLMLLSLTWGEGKRANFCIVWGEGLKQLAHFCTSHCLVFTLQMVKLGQSVSPFGHNLTQSFVLPWKGRHATCGSEVMVLQSLSA